MNTQALLVILLAAGAVFFIGFRFYKTLSGKNKGSGCADCGVDEKKVPAKKI